MYIEVLTHDLNHDGKHVPQGSIIEVSNPAGEALIDIGAAEKSTAAKAKALAKTKEAEDNA